ncbi:hypothetical protein TNCV_1329841 [Trichonephila clavipes]|uniref:Uncharacterized protein n=1 Tax=Trichonephila clavipes TaxID=2585209 RepID=A0A8X6UZC9_TRICX|nr:hypothetical protein TNCV_1329841 [Trichonephila clavipes]
MTTSRYLLPDAVLGRGPQDIEAIRSKGAQHCDAASLGYVSLAPSKAEQASQDLHHCSTSALTLPQRQSLSNSVQSFHDAEMTSCWAAMQFFEYLWDADRGDTNGHLNVFPSSDSIFGIEHHS